VGSRGAYDGQIQRLLLLGHDLLGSETIPVDEPGQQPRHSGDARKSPSESLLRPWHLLQTAEYGKSSALVSSCLQPDTSGGVLHGFFMVCNPVVTPSVSGMWSHS